MKYSYLARQAIETYLKTGQFLQPPVDLKGELAKKRAGVFVSLHKKDGQLRGCIGTILPTKENIFKEIVDNAISSAFGDPRFYPLQIEELPQIKISVDILSMPEETLISGLNPKRYGVIIKSDNGRVGLLLPDIEGVKTVEQQIAIASQKAGIDLKTNNYKLYRFKVKRVSE